MVPVHKVTRPVDGIDYPRRVVCQFTLHTSSRRFLTDKPEIIIINITSTSYKQLLQKHYESLNTSQ